MDRNNDKPGGTIKFLLSLSARRAWIEISYKVLLAMLNAVALRKESVDRNATTAAPAQIADQSLSARRAWIEMLILYISTLSPLSLSARRAWIEIFVQ